MGAAAIVGDQRVTISNLDTEATKLASAGQAYPSVFTLSQQQIAQQTLSWLIRFKINDQLASSAGINVTNAQAQLALAGILAQVQQSSGSSVTLQELLVANGIAPNLAPQVGRYQAIETQFIKNLNGGTLPTTNSPALTTALQHQQCLAAKSLNIKVNPQFGRMDYSKYQVVAGPDTVSRPSGTAQTTSLSGLAPAC
jgi:hypothetical protein